MRLDTLIPGWAGDLSERGWIERPRARGDAVHTLIQLPDRLRRQLAALRLPGSDREALSTGRIVDRHPDWRRGRTALGRRSREGSLTLQQTRLGRRLRQALLGSALDPLEGAILRALIAGPEHSGKGGDLQVPFPVIDLAASLDDHFSGRAIDEAIGRLATAGLVLRLGEDIYLTAAGPNALGRMGRFRGVSLGRRATPWIVSDPQARAEAEEALARARQQLSALQALDPPPAERRSIDEALERIERVAAALR